MKKLLNKLIMWALSLGNNHYAFSKYIRQKEKEEELKRFERTFEFLGHIIKTDLEINIKINPIDHRDYSKKNEIVFRHGKAEFKAFLFYDHFMSIEVFRRAIEEFMMHRKLR